MISQFLAHLCQVPQRHAFFFKSRFDCHAGTPVTDSAASWERCWAAVKAVWASKWNERAFSSLQRAGLDHSQLCMAVLCQEVVAAKFSFVSHTRHPTAGLVSLYSDT